MEEKKLYGNLTVYRARGAYLRRLEQFEKAKASYDEAFKTNPDDVPLLIGRSQVCADAVKPEQAYADSELALAIDPRNMNARNVQARAMYTMSDFERSLVINFRGSRVRHQPHYFFEGISQCKETLEDCVGVNAGNVMLDFLPIIKQNAEARKSEDEPIKKLHKCRIPKQEIKEKLTQMEFRRQQLLSRVLAMKYLGPMAYDKFYLKELVEDRRLISANSKGSQELKTLAKEALHSLSERQDMLRSQRPYYCIKLAEKAESKRQDNYQKEMLERDRLINTRTATRLLLSIEKSLRDGKLMDLMAKAERLQPFLDMKTQRNLPDKQVFIDRLYRAVGQGYLAQHRLSYTLSESSIRRRIGFLMGLPIGRPSSFDSVLGTYPFKFVDIKLTTEKVMNDLEICENSYMRCYLMYELARLLCIQKNFALSKFYAKRCQREAQEIGSHTWWLNACYALLSGDMKQGNTNEVHVAVEAAYQYAKRMQDPESTQAFLLKCSQIAQETVPPDEYKAIVQRENQILKIMDDKSRVETQVLFKRMSTVPRGRRFAVLPRPQERAEPKSERRKRYQKGLSVIPGLPQRLRTPPKTIVSGFQTFDI